LAFRQEDDIIIGDGEVGGVTKNAIKIVDNMMS